MILIHGIKLKMQSNLIIMATKPEIDRFLSKVCNECNIDFCMSAQHSEFQLKLIDAYHNDFPVRPLDTCVRNRSFLYKLDHLETQDYQHTIYGSYNIPFNLVTKVLCLTFKENSIHVAFLNKDKLNKTIMLNKFSKEAFNELIMYLKFGMSLYKLQN